MLSALHKQKASVSSATAMGSRYSALVLLLLLFALIDVSMCSPLQQKSGHVYSLLPPGAQMELAGDPFQSRWLSARPFQDYPRPQSEELGLLLQYLDTKRSNAPLMGAAEDAQQAVAGGSPLGTMRFGKRRVNSPLGTMRFG